MATELGPINNVVKRQTFFCAALAAFVLVAPIAEPPCALIYVRLILLVERQLLVVGPP